MKTNPKSTNGIPDLEVALDILNESAEQFRPGSFPSVQLHRQAAALGLLLAYVKLEDVIDTCGQNQN